MLFCVNLTIIRMETDMIRIKKFINTVFKNLCWLLKKLIKTFFKFEKSKHANHVKHYQLLFEFFVVL